MDNSPKVYENEGYVRGDPDIGIETVFEKGKRQGEVALILLKYMKEHGEKEVSRSELSSSIGNCNKNTYYKTLNKLLKHHYIRRMGKNFILDSSFSLYHIRLAQAWIKFSDIKSKDQKEAIIRAMSEMLQ